jgi:hypothetical protein
MRFVPRARERQELIADGVVRTECGGIGAGDRAQLAAVAEAPRA